MELTHEIEEFRVVTFVANYEARIDRPTVGKYCVCVSPRLRLGLVQHDIALRVEPVSGSEPRYAGADDGDPHLRRNPPRRPQLLPTG